MCSDDGFPSVASFGECSEALRELKYKFQIGNHGDKVYEENGKWAPKGCNMYGPILQNDKSYYYIYWNFHSTDRPNSGRWQVCKDPGMQRSGVF